MGGSDKVLVRRDKLIRLRLLVDEAQPEADDTRSPAWLVAMQMLNAMIDRKAEPEAQTSTPPPHYDPATVAFPSYAADIEALRYQVARLMTQIGTHCREQHVTREELGKLSSELRQEMVTQEELDGAILVHRDNYGHYNKTAIRMEAEAAVAEALKAHEEATVRD